MKEREPRAFFESMYEGDYCVLYDDGNFYRYNNTELDAMTVYRCQEEDMSQKWIAYADECDGAAMDGAIYTVESAEKAPREAAITYMHNQGIYPYKIEKGDV